MIFPVLVLWLLTQSYEGIWHDGVLYSFQALAHVHPDLLGNDLFLRYGSQDQYSLFSRLYALAIPALGLEPAAALLTAVMQIGLLLSIWALTRRLLPTQLVLPALATTLALPSVYGAAAVFHYFENFVSPRMGAEALALLSIASWIGGSRRKASMLWLLCCSLHVLMGAAAAAFVVWLTLLDGRRRLALLLMSLGAIALLLASLHPSWRMDDVWFDTIRKPIGYLFLSDWSTETWLSTTLPLLVLLCAGIALRNSLPGRIAAAAAATGVSGLALSWLGGDVLHLTLIIQVQPWRWMWLSALLAALLLPQLVLTLWHAGRVGRITVYLLASLYLLATPKDCLILAPITLGAAWLATRDPQRVLPGNSAKLAERGAQVLCAGALLWNLGCKVLLIPSLFAFPQTTSGAERVRTLGQDGVLAVLLVLAAAASWRWLNRSAREWWWYGAWTIPLALSLWFNLPGWSHRDFNAPLQTAMGEWRSMIPERTEVFIPEEPLLGWALLLRPSYFSPHQALSEVFSRAAAVEVKVRAKAASAFLSANSLQPWLDLRIENDGTSTLAVLCAGTGLRFVVARGDLHATPLATLPAAVGKHYAKLKLYDCTRP